MSVFVIAEAGANHDRDFKQATALIDAAVEAKADAVKFQTYSSNTLYAKGTPDFAGYENINDLIESIELPREWQRDLKLYCDDVGIEFMSTPFDERAVDELYSIGVKRFKIAGFESTDPRVVKYVAKTKLPLVISAGIGCDVKMIGNILGWVKRANPEPDVTFLHCNNAYPTPLQDINLGQITKIKTEYGEEVKVGLSDHTEGIFVPPLAVALGAECVEKHFTLDRSLPGPDHGFAIEPAELKQMVINIRKATAARGTKTTTGVSKSEAEFVFARRSVVASKKIQKGQLITEDNVTTKRPAVKNSIPAYKYYDILGYDILATRAIEEDEVLKWGDIKSLWP